MGVRKWNTWKGATKPATHVPAELEERHPFGPNLLVAWNNLDNEERALAGYDSARYIALGLERVGPLDMHVMVVGSRHPLSPQSSTTHSHNPFSQAAATAAASAPKRAQEFLKVRARVLEEGGLQEEHMRMLKDRKTVQGSVIELFQTLTNHA